jgi:hypothetical protein
MDDPVGWETNWADTRIHGTKRQVAAKFAEEKPACFRLPPRASSASARMSCSWAPTAHRTAFALFARGAQLNAQKKSTFGLNCLGDADF